MSRRRVKRDDNNASSTVVRARSRKSAGVSNPKTSMRSVDNIYAIKEDQPDKERVFSSEELGIRIEFTDYESNTYVNDSFPFTMNNTRSRSSDGLSPVSTTSISLITLPQRSQILDSSKTDIAYDEDVAKLTCEFDESVYRTDDSKSDEEFLDPRFLEDMEKRLKEREDQYRRRTMNRDRPGTFLQILGDSKQARESNLAVEAKEHIVQEVLNRRKELPRLQGFLEKQSPAMHSRWQRRWVVVLDYTIMYFKEKVNICSREEAKKHGCLNELPLTTVEKITKDDKCKGGDRFEIAALDPRSGNLRQYIWRCKDAELCNYWVNGLVQHKDQSLSELKIGARSRSSVFGMTTRSSESRKKS